MRIRLDVLGGGLGLLLGWGWLGSRAVAHIGRLASNLAETLAPFGDRAAPAGLAFGLILGFLLWSLLWTVVGVACARSLAARLRRPTRVRRAGAD